MARKRTNERELANRESNGEFQCVPLREFLREERPAAERVIDLLVAQYESLQCDGLFLTAVSHDGWRLPVDTLIRRLRQRCPLRCAVVDGCQALAHLPDDVGLETCDLLIASGHKWLGCGVPTGLGILPRAATRQALVDQLNRELRLGLIDDALLRLTHGFSSGQTDRFSETVNLSPLFAVAASVGDPQNERRAVELAFHQRRENVEAVAECLTESRFRPVLCARELRVGMLLAQMTGLGTEQMSGKRLAIAGRSAPPPLDVSVASQP